MSDFYSCESPSAYREVIRVARKEHVCCECFQKIIAGEAYQYISGIWDCTPESYKTCKSCSDVRDGFTSLKENDSAIIGGLREEISGAFCTGFGIEEYSKYSGIPLCKLKRLFGK